MVNEELSVDPKQTLLYCSFAVRMFKYESSWQPWAWQSEATIFHRTDNSRRHFKCLYNSWTLPKKITLIFCLIDNTNWYSLFRKTLEIKLSGFWGISSTTTLLKDVIHWIPRCHQMFHSDWGEGNSRSFYILPDRQSS